jgi:hypothetical protein
MLINGKAVYGKYGVDIKGLSSGAPGTAECNGFKMHQIVMQCVALLHGDWDAPFM